MLSDKVNVNDPLEGRGTVVAWHELVELVDLDSVTSLECDEENSVFYIGQPADGAGGARDVAKRTGRGLLHIDSLQGEEWVRVFDSKHRVGGVMGGVLVVSSVKDCPPARYTYDSGEVIRFELSRREDGNGPLVYRVKEIGRVVKDAHCEARKILDAANLPIIENIADATSAYADSLGSGGLDRQDQ